MQHKQFVRQYLNKKKYNEKKGLLWPIVNKKNGLNGLTKDEPITSPLKIQFNPISH